MKGEFSFDSWTDLTAKGGSKGSKKSKEDPQASIMNLMKDMYDNGDEKMKETIGKAMYDSRMGKKAEMPEPGDLGGLGGM